MVVISQGERLGQPCKLLFPGAPLLGILSLFLSVQQLCSGGLMRLAKPLENGEASIGGHQKPAGLWESLDWTAGGQDIHHVKDQGGGAH